MRETNQVLQYRNLAVVAMLAAFWAISSVIGANTASAMQVIVQDPDEKWLAFEAEDYHQLLDLDDDGITWTTIDDLNVDPSLGASGGKAIEAGAPANFDSNEAEAVYNVKFTRPDFYGVYARYKNLGVSGNNDSIWTSGDPNSFPLDPLRTWFSPSPAEILRTLGSDPNQLADPATPTPEYFYARIGLASISFDADPANNAAEVNEVLEFRVGIREEGAILDRIVFADASNPGPVDQTGGGLYAPLFQLDALPNSPVEGAPSVPGDYNNSGLVEQGDLDLVLLNWGAIWPPTIAGWVNQQPTDDGVVNQNDLDGVLLNWGNVAIPASVPVPEPTTSLLLMVGGMMIAMRRRRR